MDSDRRRAICIISCCSCHEPKEKKPLYRTPRQPAEFPLQALGPLRDVTEAIIQLTQAPAAMVAQSVLAAATLGAQPHYDIQLAGGTRPLSCIFATIAESGERKSTVDGYAIAPIREVEEQWIRRRIKDDESYRVSRRAWEVAKKHAELHAKGDRQAIELALNSVGREPKPPASAMVIVKDMTPEGLTLHLEGGRPFVGVFTSEGGTLIWGASFTDDNGMKTASLFNELWDGADIRRRRVTTGETFLLGRRFAAHIMMQGVVAERLFGNAMFESIGLTARMLTVAPTTTVGSRFHREPCPDATLRLQKYSSQLKRLLTQPLRVDAETGALKPKILTLGSAAKRLWIDFYNLCEAACAPGQELSTVRGFGAKLAEHAGRLAAVLAVSHDPDVTELPEWAMESAVQLAYFYASEILRLREISSVSVEYRCAELLLDWWKRQFPVVHLAQIYQLGPSSIRNADTARSIVGILLEHGYVAALQPGTVVDGKARKESWILIAD